MDPEQQPLLNNAEAAPAAERPGLSVRSWIFVACGVVAVVSGVALVSTMPNDRAPAVIAKRLNLAKTRAVKYTSLSKTEQLSLFDEFKTTYGRSYKDDQEEDSKFAAFQAFLQMADDRNAAEAAAGLPEPAVHGLTQFADMTAEEFASMYLTGLKMPKMGVNDAAVDEKPVLTFDDVLKYRTKEAKAGKEAEKSLEEVDPLLETLPKDMQKALKKGAEAVKQAKLQGKEAKEAVAKAGLPPLEEMMAKYDAAASKGKGPEHARALAEHTSKKQAGKQEDGVNGGVTCKSTCYGYTCDDWGNWGYTCTQMTKYYGCDCTGCYCTAGQPTAAPTGSNKCASTCMGYTCDALGKYGYTCATLQKTYGCDCSGCSCSAGQPTPAPTGSGKCTSNCFGNYNCDQYANTCAQLTGWGCDCTGCQCTYGMPTVAPTNYPTSTGAKDWTGIYTTPVEDQGSCGSCWTFSATAQMESDSIRLGLLPLASTSSLSKQELVSCDTTCNGCNGGLPSIAYNWVQANGGITTAINYPYSKNAYTYGKADKCVQPSANSNAVTVSSWAYAPTETAMQNYVRATGPLSVGLAADILQTYQSGVISAAACGSSKMQDHAVQMVGVDLGNGYFKIRNSWSTGWGEQGFFRLQTVTGGSVNTCNIVGLYCAPGYSCPTGGTYTTMIAVKHSPAAETKGKSVSEDKMDEKMETKKGAKKAEKEEKETKENSKKEEKKEAKKEAKEEKKESKEEPKKMEKKEEKEAKKEAKEPKKMGHTAGKA